MAETMTFELVSPERRLAAGEVEMVTIPGMAGELGVMPGHAPVFTSLRPGLVTVKGGDAAGEYFVIGGFAEITAEGVSVLADEGVSRGDLSRDYLEARIEKARAAHEAHDAEDHDRRRSSSQQIDDLLHAVEHLF